TELPDPIEYFNLTGFAHASAADRDGVVSEVERVFSYVRSAIGIADHWISNPVTTVRAWSRSDKPQEKHWRAKLEQILQRPGIARGRATAEQGRLIRRRCNNESRNYIGFRIADGLECIVTDLAAAEMRCDGEPQAFDDIAADDFFSSPAWRA